MTLLCIMVCWWIKAVSIAQFLMGAFVRFSLYSFGPSRCELACVRVSVCVYAWVHSLTETKVDFNKVTAYCGTFCISFQKGTRVLICFSSCACRYNELQWYRRQNPEITRWLWTCLWRYSTGILKKKKKTSNALIANTSIPSTLVCLSKLNTPALPFVLENASNWLKEAITVPGSSIDFMKVCNYFNWNNRVSIRCL